MRIIFIFLIFFVGEVAASESFSWYSLVQSKFFNLPEHVAIYLFVAICLLIFAFSYRVSVKRRRDPLLPDSKPSLRNVVDVYTNFIISMARPVLGEYEAKKNFSFFASTFIIIFVNNSIGLVPGIRPPTEHLSTTLALGLLSFVFYNTRGIASQGLWAYIKHFAGPFWYMAILIFPIELISHCFRPLTLSLRLRGNMMGDHIVLSTFNEIAPILLPTFFMVLGAFVCLIQAYVFTMLSIVYISIAVRHD